MRWPCLLSFLLLATWANAQTWDLEYLLDRSWELTDVAPDSARYYAQQAVVQATAIGDSASISLAHRRIGLACQHSNELELAMDHFQRALAIDQRANNHAGIISSLQKIGVLQGKRGQNKSGHDSLIEALKVSENSGDDEDVARCCYSLGSICADMGLYEEAINYTFRALTLRKRIGDAEGIRNSTHQLANVYVRMKKYETALRLHKEHLQMQRSVDEPIGLADAYLGLSVPHYHMGHMDSALAFADSALRIYRGTDFAEGEILARTAYADALLGSDRIAEAEDEFRSLLRMIATDGTAEDRAETLFALASLLNGSGRYPEAEVMLREVVQWCRTARARELELAALDELAASLRARGHLEEALVFFESARDIQDSMFNEGTTRELASAEMKEKYNADARNSEITGLKAEIDLRMEREARRMLLLILVIVVAVALLVFTGLLARNLQHRKRLMAQQQTLHMEEVNGLMRSQEIRSLEALLEGQDKERDRIAQDLHDVLGSKLSATKFQFITYDGTMQRTGPEQEAAYQKVFGLIDEAVKEVRRISHDLAGGTITRNGIAPVLRALCDTVHQPGVLEVELAIFGMEARLDHRIELALYRMVQELVSNVLKHARASHLSIQVTRANGDVNVIVEDDGVGFDPVHVEGGMGLTGVRTRATELGGTVQVDPRPGLGTSITIVVPITVPIPKDRVGTT